MFWKFWRRKKVGLVLGGGVARGMAHIGVLKVLQAHKVPVDLMVGVSSGSLVGAAYAAGMELSLIEEIALRIRWADLIKITFFRPGFISPKAIEDFVVRYLGEKKFSELKIPFAVVATDLFTGEAVVISEGSVAKAIAASCAFPGVFAPEEREGKWLVDGGLAENVPVEVAKKMGADFVIASDVIPSELFQLPQDPLRVLGRSIDLVLKKLSQAEAKKADILLELSAEEDIWQLDFQKAKKLIVAGEVAAHRALSKIKRSLGLRS